MNGRRIVSLFEFSAFSDSRRSLRGEPEPPVTFEITELSTLNSLATSKSGRFHRTIA